jgi:D-glycero-D-manno-heptose 1,7-bisphosphate phosphatase
VSTGRPALLLDRDGVINQDHGYVATLDRFVFCDGIFDLARRAVDCGFLLVVITNQSGIARGYYSEGDFQRLSAWMGGEFARRGAPLAGIFHCPYLPGGTVAGLDRDSYWRKPNPGMILEAARLLDLDLARSIFLGDQPTDMSAAARAGVGLRVLLRPDRPASTTPESAAHLTLGRLAELTRRLPWP